MKRWIFILLCILTLGITACAEKKSGDEPAPAGNDKEAKPDAAKPDAPKPDAAKPDAAKPDAAKPDAGGALVLSALDGLKVPGAPAGTKAQEMLGDQMLQGPGLVMTIGAAKDTDPKTAEDALKEAEMYSPTNPKTEALADGFILTFENTGGAGTNYWLIGRRELGGKAYKCSTTSSSGEQQAAAVAACKSLTK